jgi:hypothetical protein
MKIGRPVFLWQAPGIQEDDFIQWYQRQNRDRPGNDQPPEFAQHELARGFIFQ